MTCRRVPGTVPGTRLEGSASLVRLRRGSSCTSRWRRRRASPFVADPASPRPIVLPALITLPSAVSLPSQTGLRKLIFSSTVVNESPSARSETHAHPIAPSARSQRIPPCSVPGGLACCGPASSSKVTRPSSAATIRMPISLPTAGRDLAGHDRRRSSSVTAAAPCGSRRRPHRLERVAPALERAGARDHAGEVELALERPLREPREVLLRQVVAAVRDEDASPAWRTAAAGRARPSRRPARARSGRTCRPS